MAVESVCAPAQMTVMGLLGVGDDDVLAEELAYLLYQGRVPETGDTGVTFEGTTDVYVRPGEPGDIAGTLAAGTTVSVWTSRVIGGATWYYVSSAADLLAGWVHGSWITVTLGARPAATYVTWDHNHSAGAITYDPGVWTDWDGDTDPGNVSHALDQLADRVDDLEGSAVGGVVPVGGIIMWSGSIATIPANWALCDGANSTPDLRDRFIVGAKQDDGGVAKTNLTGSLTQSGGAVAHQHAAHTVTQPSDHAAHTHAYTEIVNHTHAVSITDPGHAHDEYAPTSANSGTVLFANDTNASGSSDSTLDTGSSTTGISATTANPSGGVASGTTGNPSATLSHSGTAVDAHDTLSAPQPYYALAFIMRTA